MAPTDRSLEERMLSGEVGPSQCNNVHTLNTRPRTLQPCLQAEVMLHWWAQFTDRGSTKERLTRPLRKALAKDPVGPGEERNAQHGSLVMHPVGGPGGALTCRAGHCLPAGQSRQTVAGRSCGAHAGGQGRHP